MGMVPMNSLVNWGHIYRKYISSLWSKFIYGGYLTSLGSPILIICTAILVNASVNAAILLIAYLIPLIVYNINYYMELEKDAETNFERVTLINKKRGVYPFIIGFYIITLILMVLLYTNLNLMAFIVILSLSGILYTIIFKDFTKRIPCIKNVYTSLIWASNGTFFLVFYYSTNVSWAYLFIFLFIFIKSLVNVVFFDIKDIKVDRERYLKTIPVILGKDNTILVLQILNVIAFVPLLAGVAIRSLPIFALSLLVLYVYTFAYLKKAKGLGNNEIRTAAYTFAEAEIMLWPIILLAGKVICGII